MATELPSPPPEGDMRHPEIENGLFSPDYLRRRKGLKDVVTSIDLLEIPQNPMAEARWHEGLDHNALLQHFEVYLLMGTWAVMLIGIVGSTMNLLPWSLSAPRFEYCMYIEPS